MATTVTTKKPERQEGKAPVGRPLSLWSDFPFTLSRMRDEFDRMLERFSQDWPLVGEKNGWRWDVSVEDKDDAVEVRAEAPGFEPGDFDLQVSDGRLVMKAERKSATKDKEGESWQRREYYHSFSLPTGIDKDKVDASYHNGVLTITLPKTPEGKGRKIAVKGK
jgi:HSP20 family protein